MKNWWNDEWRDRMYAAIAYLGGPAETVVFPLGASASFSLSKQPIPFESPVSYLEPGEVLKDEDLADYDFEDEDSDLDESDSMGVRVLPRNPSRNDPQTTQTR